jgi:O-Antigen ligase
MEHPDLAQIAALAGALGSALVLLGRGRRALLAGLAALALAQAGLAVALGARSFDAFLSASGAAAALLAGAALAGAAALLARRPALVPVAVLATAPLRPPLDVSPSNRFLVSVAEDGALGRLLPLYFVLAAAGAALAWRILRGDSPRSLPRPIALPAAAFLALAFASLLWADDLEAGANLLAFFTLPFAVLLAVVARAPYPSWMPRALGIVGVTLAALFAAVGLFQAATHNLFFYAPKLEVANANSDVFRVTSLFGDPSLYARHVVLGMAVVLAALAASRMRAWPGIAVLALLFGGLLFSYSQSSMAALLAVVLAVAWITGDMRVRRVVAIAAALSVLAAGAYVGARVESGGELRKITSDRTTRIQDTLRVVGAHPILGVGIGGQPRASRRLAPEARLRNRPTGEFVSHTTPLTVAAELGIVGLALYAWLLVGGTRLIVAVGRLDEGLGLALGATFLALFVHALSYSGFLEDPITWVILGVAAGWLTWPHAAAQRERRPATARAAATVAA